MAYTPYFVKSVQHLNLQVQGSQNVTISVVNTSYTSLNLNQTTSADQYNKQFPFRCYLADATTIRLEQTSPIGFVYVYIDVVEYYPGFLRQAVQFPYMNMANVGSASAAVNALGPKAFVLNCGYILDGLFSGVPYYGLSYYLRLSGNSVIVQRHGPTSPASEVEFGVRACVVDPK